MKIVVLDGHTTNPGDLSWEDLQSLGDCEIHDRTAPEEVAQRMAGARVVLTNKTIIAREHIEQSPELVYIGVLATGYNIVDIEAARERNIPVANVPTYGTASVAQAVFAHVLNLTQHVAYHAETVRQGRWTKSTDFCYWDFPLIELAGSTMGIVGFGRIGRATAELARAFGMNVIAYDTEPQEDVPEGIEMVDLERLFQESDVVSLHCPLTAENEKLVNADRLSTMKPTAILINTSRGPLVDEGALAGALNSSRIAGASLDVLAVEPPVADNPLLTAKNCNITPHIAWATRAARGRLLNTVVENIRAFAAGKPRNVVNG